jgi:hypothetical protein
MMKKNNCNVFLAAKHIDILRSRLENLELTNKVLTPDYAQKAQSLYTISFGFAIMMMMNKNVELFQKHLNLCLETITKMMRLLETDPYHKDQSVILILLASLYMRNRFKMSLKCCFLA